MLISNHTGVDHPCALTLQLFLFTCFIEAFMASWLVTCFFTQRVFKGRTEEETLDYYFTMHGDETPWIITTPIFTHFSVFNTKRSLLLGSKTRVRVHQTNHNMPRTWCGLRDPSHNSRFENFLRLPDFETFRFGFVLMTLFVWGSKPIYVCSSLVEVQPILVTLFGWGSVWWLVIIS